MERRKQLEDLDYVSNIKLVNIKLSIKVSHFKRFLISNWFILLKKPLSYQYYWVWRSFHVCPKFTKLGPKSFCPKLNSGELFELQCIFPGDSAFDLRRHTYHSNVDLVNGKNNVKKKQHVYFGWWNSVLHANIFLLSICHHWKLVHGSL